MFTWGEFAIAVAQICNVTIDAAVAGDPQRENPNQKQIVNAAPNTSLFVIAGPGSGKTTSATLRILKLIYVDALPPEAVFATTFTRKAASMLRSRITAWGEEMRDRFGAAFPERKALLDLLDLNRVRVGTLDSLAQDILNDNKRAGDPRPSPVEEHVLTSIMLTEAIFQSDVSRWGAKSNSVGAFLRPLFPQNWNHDPGRAQAFIELRQRFLNDQVDRPRLRASADPTTAEGEGLIASLDAIERFENAINQREIYDFASINEAFLEGLSTDRLATFLSELRFVLVDEYQDTNYLQEAIYFRLAAAAAKNGGSISVVGDDDQSLYRFRGATVELFAGFEQRLAASVGITPVRIPLDRNYRSTPQIVQFVNDYVQLDPAYAAARVPGKPALQHGGANNNSYPVFGLFRQSEQAVADAIARLVAKLQSGTPIIVPAANGEEFEIALNSQDGSAGDVAVLTYSTREFGERTPQGVGRRRFPRKLRDALDAAAPPVKVFNPRGCPLRDIPQVQELLGNVLDCIDPDGHVQGQMSTLTAHLNCLDEWRTVARDRRPARASELSQFVQSWGTRTPTRPATIARVPLNDVIFKLITWLPDFQNDIEHLAWLEAVQRGVSAAAVLQGFGGDVIFDKANPYSDIAVASLKQVYRRILIPIADGIIDVSEDVLETLPMDRVNVMTIHQAKGLEFPITIVDVGTALEDLRWMTPRNRYPNHPDTPHVLEDAFRPFSNINLPNRSGRDRAFDDLVRNYFVAFSRAQDVLVLAGHNYSYHPKPAGTKACHVGSGWIRPSGAAQNLWPWENQPMLTLLEEQYL